MFPLHVTVIVCTRDRPAQLQACLDALSHQDYPRFDILVVDNAGARPVDEICRIKGIACVQETAPGLTRARNFGARAAHGELIAYIDDDAIPEQGWLEALAREFSDPAVAAVAGRTRYMNARGDTLFMSDEPAADDMGPRPRRSFNRETPDWFVLACFGGIGDGNTMAFRRDAVVNLNGFDERLGRGRLLEGGDEHVAFMSLIAEGYSVNYAPEAIVRHPTPAMPELLRARRWRDLRSSIAYVIFLWAEFPAHRRDIFHFLRRAVMKRILGTDRPQSASVCLTRSQSMTAMLDGIRVYWKARQEWKTLPRPAENKPDPAIAPLIRPMSRAR
jgi:cellulose synthase/poly-beta-1,6-N-acetylglucosamine synthase-like glycosyltransferase